MEKDYKDFSDWLDMDTKDINSFNWPNIKIDIDGKTYYLPIPQAIAFRDLLNEKIKKALDLPE